MVQIYSQFGLQFAVQDGNPYSVTGKVCTVPIPFVDDFIRSGLARDPARLALYIQDSANVVDEARAAGGWPGGVTQDTERSRRYLNVVRPFFPVSITLHEELVVSCRDCAAPLNEDEDRLLCLRCAAGSRRLGTVAGAVPVALTGPSDRPSLPPTLTVAKSLNACKELEEFVAALDFSEARVGLSEGVLVELLSDLDQHFRERSVPTRVSAARLRCLDSGIKPGTSVDQMVSALKAIKRTCLHHANYLCVIYWGWERLDLGEAREQMIQNHSRLLAVVDRVLIQFQVLANFSPYFYACRHAHAMGLAIPSEYFRSPKTRADLAAQVAIFNQACKLAGLYQPLSGAVCPFAVVGQNPAATGTATPSTGRRHL